MHYTNSAADVAAAVMSALPAKADIRRRQLDVRFGPKGDIVTVVQQRKRPPIVFTESCKKHGLKGKPRAQMKKV